MKIKNDNRGSGIVTVVVVTMFITIIATTMIYIAARNYQTKQVDYQNKVSFYQAEEALDTLKSLLAQDVSDAFMYAYADTMSNYAEYGSDINKYYADSYTKKMMKYWSDRVGSGSNLDAVKTYMRERLIDNSPVPLSDDEKTEINNMIGCITAVGEFKVPPSNDKFVITGIEASYTSKNGYSTYIKVDMGLELPDINLVTTSAPTEDTVKLTDCVKYMNWQRDED
jgi:hypothetical protein